MYEGAPEGSHQSSAQHKCVVDELERRGPRPPCGPRVERLSCVAGHAVVPLRPSASVVDAAAAIVATRLGNSSGYMGLQLRRGPGAVFPAGCSAAAHVLMAVDAELAALRASGRPAPTAVFVLSFVRIHGPLFAKTGSGQTCNETSPQKLDCFGSD